MWTRLTLEVPGDLSDLVSGLLFESGTCGIQVEDGSDRTHVRLSAYFETAAHQADAERSLDRLRQTEASIGQTTGEPVADEGWGDRWKEFFQPIRVGDGILVGPPWADMQAEPGGMVIVIEPKMAFGTGRHESTRIALDALRRSIHRGDRILDLGTGSAILSIAAAKLGARCLAVDNDPVAVENARENLSANGVSDLVDTLCGSLDDVPPGLDWEGQAIRKGSPLARPASPCSAPFDVIVANLQTNILIPLLGDLRARVRPGGRLILSGILDREEGDIRAALLKASWGEPEVTSEGEWIGVVADRPA